MARERATGASDDWSCLRGAGLCAHSDGSVTCSIHRVPVVKDVVLSVVACASKLLRRFGMDPLPGVRLNPDHARRPHPSHSGMLPGPSVTTATTTAISIWGRWHVLPVHASTTPRRRG